MIQKVDLDVVTGAFSFTGRYIARRLLAEGRCVRTLTGHPERPNQLGGRVEVAPYDFDRPERLAANLEGVRAIFNTYWVRFPYRGMTFETAIANTQSLIDAAKRAGVRRFVHLSVSNPSLDSPLPYFKGKAILEKLLIESGLSYVIVRPTLVFGLGDILINNIAWLLRNFPVFVIPGSGEYWMKPISAEDLAAIAVDASKDDRNVVIDAAGPEIYTFNELVRILARAVRSKSAIVHLNPRMTMMVLKLIGLATRDVTLTADELRGLMANLLVTEGAATGQTRFSEWLPLNADMLGIAYESELARHFPRQRVAP
jgi:nucleoside-diphosphate-sugar epimerase